MAAAKQAVEQIPGEVWLKDLDEISSHVHYRGAWPEFERLRLDGLRLRYLTGTYQLVSGHEKRQTVLIQVLILTKQIAALAEELLRREEAREG